MLVSRLYRPRSGSILTSQKYATFYGLAAVLCWSTVATAFKLSLQSLSPVQLILVASVVSWLFLVIVLAAQGRLPELFLQSAAVYRVSFLFGLLNPTLYYFLLLSAYDQLPAQEAQAINFSWAIVMSLLAVPLLGQRLTKFDLIAAVSCYLGVLVIATRGDIFSLEFANITGVLLALVSTLVWSLYWIFNKRDPRPPILGLCLNFTFALPVIFLLVWLTSDFQAFAFPSNWRGLAGGAYVGIFEMGLAFVLWLQAMKHAENTARIANLIFIAPFLSLLLIATFLGEAILPSTIVGLVLIVAGLGVQQRFSSTGKPSIQDQTN